MDVALTLLLTPTLADAATTGRWYWPTWWLVWTLGFVPAVYFVTTWRPARRNLLALDVGGWVAVVLLAYVRSAVLAVAGAEYPTMARGIFGLVFGAAIGGLVCLRAYNWHCLRAAGPPRRRHDDPPVGAPP